MKYKVVAEVPHAESGGTQQHTYESADRAEVASYLLGLAHEHKGQNIAVTITATDDE